MRSSVSVVPSLPVRLSGIPWLICTSTVTQKLRRTRRPLRRPRLQVLMRYVIHSRSFSKDQSLTQFHRSVPLLLTKDSQVLVTGRSLVLLLVHSLLLATLLPLVELHGMLLSHLTGLLHQLPLDKSGLLPVPSNGKCHTTQQKIIKMFPQ